MTHQPTGPSQPDDAGTEAPSPGHASEGPEVPHPDVEVLRPQWLERWRRRIARNRPMEAAYRAVVLVVGLAIVAAGVAMLVFPGPGWAAIILGLVVLATEYAWAERLLLPVQRFVRWLAARALDPASRRQNLLIVAVLAVLAALALWWYLARYGATLEPLPLL